MARRVLLRPERLSPEPSMNLRLAAVLVALSPFTVMAAAPAADAPPAAKSAKKTVKTAKKKKDDGKKAAKKEAEGT